MQEWKLKVNNTEIRAYVKKVAFITIATVGSTVVFPFYYVKPTKNIHWCNLLNFFNNTTKIERVYVLK